VARPQTGPHPLRIARQIIWNGTPIPTGTVVEAGESLASYLVGAGRTVPDEGTGNTAPTPGGGDTPALALDITVQIGS